MKLHLSSINDIGLFYLENRYVPPPKPMNMKKMKKEKDHNIMMIDIASSLNYSKFDDVKDFPTTFDMWEKQQRFYGGDKNVQIAKIENLRGKFDRMKMK